jgi:hypothetical protein
MKIANRIFITIALMACVIPASGAASAHPDSDLPDASSVVTRVLERAAQVARNTNAAPYIYDKRSLVEELDAKGQSIKATEKIYRVVIVQGLPFSRLVKIEGRDLTATELRKEDLQEQEFRRKITARDFNTMARQKETWINRELLDRYEFKILRREVFEGRSTLILDFSPKKNQAPAGKVQDRILSRLAGQIWVDEADAELAKLDVHLGEPFSIGWLGLIASIHQCDLAVQRQRLPDGYWVNLKHTMFLVGRKLLSPMRYRTTEASSSFRKNDR